MLHLVPLHRDPAQPGAAVELRVRFVDDSAASVEPAALHRVEILDGATSAIVATLGAAKIDPLGDGTYRVWAPAGVAVAGTLIDRWIVTDDVDQQVSLIGSRSIAAAVAGTGDAARIEIVGGRDRIAATTALGIDLTLDDGTPYPAELFERAILESVDRLEADLDIVLIEREFVERHDYDRERWRCLNHLQLDRRPVQSVEALTVVYPTGGQGQRREFPADWLVVTQPKFGVVELVPAAGSLDGWLFNSLPLHGSPMPILRSTNRNFWPGMFEVRYRAGFKRGEVPARLRRLITLVSTRDVLNTAGDLVAGAGVSNFSIAMPGLSQSVGTTASATSAGYRARQIAHDEEIKALTEELRRQYAGVPLGVA